MTANGVTYTSAALAAVAQSDIAAALNAAQDADGNRFDALFTAFAGDGTPLPQLMKLKFLQTQQVQQVHYPDKLYYPQRK